MLIEYALAPAAIVIFIGAAVESLIGVNGPIVYAVKRSQPLSPVLTSVTFGAMARDGGHLIVEPEEVGAVRADPIAIAAIV